jgi:hypothetical protein
VICETSRRVYRRQVVRWSVHAAPRCGVCCNCEGAPQITIMFFDKTYQDMRSLQSDVNSMILVVKALDTNSWLDKITGMKNEI